MEHLDGIKKITSAELEAIIKNGKYRSREEIDSVYKLIDIMKDITCIEDMESEMYDGDYEASYGNYDGGSYARDRNRARRDSMGRYSRYGGPREMYRGSYDDGRSMRTYSRADGRDEYKENLMIAMDNAPDEQTRQSIKRMIDNM